MAQSNAFVDRIKSLSLEEIVQERRRLSEEKNGRTDRIQELAHQNYEVFTKTGETLNAVESELNSLEKSSEQLASGLATLSEQCGHFSRKSMSLEGRRRLTSLALAKHPEVMEILEIPRLMVNCVRQGSYEEALQLAADVKRMEMKIGHIPVIQNVYRDVEEQRLAMLSILISQLRGPIQLPQCVRIVGYLRRLGIYSEAELRLKFLQSRNAWLQGTLDAIQADNSYQLTLKLIETTRQNMFDIVTQYRALFSEDDPLLLIEGENRSFVNETAILPQWLSYRIRLFIRKLKETLPSIPANSLDTILDQCMYFGMSFGRVGADFRSHLVPVFLDIFFNKFSETIQKGKAAFRENLENWNVLEAARGKATSNVMNQGTDAFTPSYSLLAYTPLAELCNAFIPAFNDLRIAPPLALCHNIINVCAETLEFCAEEMATFFQKKISTGNSVLQNFFQLVTVEFRDHVVGFVQGGLNLMFPVQEMSRYAGLSMVELQNQRLSCLDKTKITASLAQFMPVESEETEELPEESSSTVEEVEPAAQETLPANEELPSGTDLETSKSGDHVDENSRPNEEDQSGVLASDDQ